MDRNHKSFTDGMLQDEVRTSLTSFVVAVTKQETNEFASGNHSVEGQRDRLGIDRASFWNRLALFAALLNVEPHSFKDADLGFVDGFAKTIYTREIFAVRIVAFSFALYGNRIAVEVHC